MSEKDVEPVKEDDWDGPSARGSFDAGRNDLGSPPSDLTHLGNYPGSFANASLPSDLSDRASPSLATGCLTTAILVGMCALGVWLMH